MLAKQFKRSKVTLRSRLDNLENAELLEVIELIDTQGKPYHYIIKTPYYEKKDIQQASDYLMNKAHRSWLDNSSIIDDITFIMIFLNYSELS